MESQSVEAIYPLAPAQEGMLFHALYHPQSRSYFNQALFELPTALDVAAFREAVARVVARHPALRSSFHWEDLDHPVQVVRGDLTCAVQEEDQRSWTEAERKAWVPRFLAQDRQTGFD